MIENSGFLTDDKESSNVSNSFTDVVCIGRSATNIYGRVNRFGKRWFFKAVAHDSPDAAEARRQLLKEFDIHISLSHPSIARIISLEHIEGFGQCIISEWIEGETLENLLLSQSLSQADRQRILHEIISAVSYIHSQGIVHRDLKPANIMIRNNGQSAVIIDFGLADTDAHLYQKLPAGTSGYASQRQFTARTPFTGDDIHALGVIIRQLYPRISTIARNCIHGQYPTAAALQAAIRRRRRIRLITSWLSAGFFIIALTTFLLFHIGALRHQTAELQNHIVTITDSLSSLHSSSNAINKALRDSLTIVCQNLDNEKNIRLNRQHRQSQIDELKRQLNQRIDNAFASFRTSQSSASPDTHSLHRLIKLLNETKNNFLANDIPFSLSQSEFMEIEYSYTLHFNEITKQWNQTLTQHRSIR